MIPKILVGLVACVSVLVLGHTEVYEISDLDSSINAAVQSGDEHDGRMSAIQATDTLRVLIYNIRHGAGMDLELDLERTAAVIIAQEPDIVLLQEVDSSAARTEYVHQAARLAQLSGLPYHWFGSFMDYDGGRYGMAVLSAWPFLEAINHRLPDGAEPRSALAVRVQPSDHISEMVFVGVHLYQTAAQRLAQAQRLVALFADEAEASDHRPVLLALAVKRAGTD